jgi:hypothetical protein
MFSHCYGLMAKGRKCANLPKGQGTGMQDAQYLDTIREAVRWLADTLAESVSVWIVGGWQGILALGAFALLMFVLTSLFNARR